MHRNNLKYLILLITVLGCIEPYVPQLKGEAEDVYVVEGEVTNHAGYQIVTLSTASPIDEPQFYPVSDGLLTIEDDKGNAFGLEEYENGRYRVWMDQEFLNPGVSYRLLITTPSGEDIISDYDTMPACPPIDSAYNMREEVVTRSGEILTGMQYYIDFYGSDTDSHFYRWTADETWEYHSPYPIEYYYNGTKNQVIPPDYSYMVCWVTKPVDKIFSVTTNNLVSNSYRKLPLHFVDNTTTKLYFGYSVLITQHALSAKAFDFWEQLRLNSGKDGGLYETQPLPVQGNLQNRTRPEKKVLGYFGASSVSQRRSYLDAVRDMGIAYDSVCSPYDLGRMGWREFTREDYPVYFTYLFINSGYRLKILRTECVDCRARGGTIVKPEFWPE
jgi:hypothetical protein